MRLIYKKISLIWTSYLLRQIDKSSRIIQMISRLLKIFLILTSFIFLTGFLPFAALLGPGLTIASSGNVYKASAQLVIDFHIKNKTGKNSFSIVKEEMVKKSNKKYFVIGLKQLVEKRVSITHQKILEQNNTKKFK
jgi:hypothetical protein